jgi:hypothetical protein
MISKQYGQGAGIGGRPGPRTGPLKAGQRVLPADFLYHRAGMR